MKQARFVNVGRSEDFYHDESGERFREVFNAAQQQVEAWQRGYKQTVFWFGVIVLLAGLVAWRASL